MTDTKKNILNEISNYQYQLRVIERATTLGWSQNGQATLMAWGFDDTAKEIFDDFKAKLAAHYESQIDELVKKLAC